MSLETANRLMYLLGFIALSGALNLLLWPMARRWLGLCCGVLALVLALLLGWQLVGVGGGWFALGQKLAFMATGATEPVVERYLPPWLAAVLLPLTDALTLYAQQALPAVSLHLGAALMFLGGYLACKLVLVPLAWFWQLAVPLRHVRRRLPGRVINIVKGALLLVGTALAVQPYLPVWVLQINMLYAIGIWIFLLELRQWLTGLSAQSGYT